MNQFFKDFTNFYSLQKTLRFELRPVLNTADSILKSNIIENDTKKADEYKIIKKLIDEYHKNFIDKCLSNINFNDAKANVEEYFKLFKKKEKTDDDKNIIREIQAILRQFITLQFSKNDKFKPLFGEDLIKNDLPNFIANRAEYGEEKAKNLEIIKNFYSFTTYFTGFHENRKNMYTKDEKSTAISYRIVNDNMPIFFHNLSVFEKIKDENTLLDECKCALNTFQEMGQIDKNLTIYDIFSIDFVLKTLTQQTIQEYNLLISGQAEHNKKMQGLNEFINLFNQKNKDKKILFLKTLKKQILSDRKAFSFVLDKFEDDKELIDTLQKFYLNIKEKNFLKEVKTILESVDSVKNIWIKRAELTNISNRLFENFSLLDHVLKEYFEKEIAKDIKTKKLREKEEKVFLKSDFINIQVVESALEFYKATHDKNHKDIYVKDYFTKSKYLENAKLIDLFETIDKKQYVLPKVFGLEFTCEKSILLHDKQYSLIIKEYLDALITLSRIVKSIRVPNDFSDEKDEDFYTKLSNFDEDFENFISLYNKIRNYLTQKPYKTEKVKINFENSTLLNGWDVNKEADNFAIIFKKDDDFYLGILNKDHKKVLHEVAEPKESEDFYEKMYYKLLPGANKMLPKVFLSEKGIKNYNPSQKILNGYKQEKHKKGENFDIGFCHELIDYFKTSISKHPDWKHFDFKFSPTSSYKDISDFYREIERDGYKIEFKKFSKNYIENLVNNGKLYLFQIYNKDFSKHSKGTPNLHTIFWKMLFNEENLRDVVYKLNGEAEIFYRPASIPKKVTHEKNVPIDNKSNSKQAIFPYDLYKDKRYAENKFLLHIPITQNFQSRGISNINEHVNQFLHINKDVNIIGLDRGEKNLLYYSIINQKGEMIEQASLNTIGGVEYHEILSERQKKIREARLNWQSIENIKELKSGYLSQVVHEISTLMIKHEAIIVLEDLNFGFKRGRQKVEKQIYQKFEKALIEKLNFLIAKDVAKDNERNNEPTGALKALQLTNRFETFEKLGKQSGFLFYIPAWNTSKIDPTTGFVNLLNPKYTSVENSKKLFDSFDSIAFNKNEDYFEFSFDYEKLLKNGVLTKKCEGIQKWTACTFGKTRYAYNAKDREFQTIDVTKELKELFGQYNIDTAQKNLIPQILNMNETDFFKKLVAYLGSTLTLRHAKSKDGAVIDDFILSPIKNKNGYFFDSKKEEEKGELAKLPINSDANGAYHIALKGLMVLKQIQSQNASDLKKIKLTVSNKDWLDFMQNKK
ncbi:MAG: type V CRISPR-associated protein Cas12a/Cpf1 [Campylobacteraceae bacterium]|jgi:CRISPR-associated protein Cpf1|nr:type V CRISPR-associated protein Cas12a/Cpf1 [Campylobacteraceae bacterium]